MESRQAENTKGRIRGAVAHIPSKKTPVATSWSQTKRTSYAKSIDKHILLEETLCATELPITSGNSLQHKKKLATPDTDRCFVVWSGQTQRAIEILQFILAWYDDQQFCRVMALTRETSIFSCRSMAYSIAYFMNIRKQKFRHMRKHVNRCEFRHEDHSGGGSN